MVKTKQCCVEGCNASILAKLDDLYQANWTAFKIGNGKVLCFCQNHFKEMKERWEKEIRYRGI